MSTANRKRYIVGADEAVLDFLRGYLGQAAPEQYRIVSAPGATASRRMIIETTPQGVLELQTLLEGIGVVEPDSYFDPMN